MLVAPSWAYLGPSPAHVEPSGPPWAYVRPSWAHVELCWAHVGPMLGLCWPMLAYVGPMLAHVEPSWKLCWGHVWASYVETILRCQFLRPGPPPGAQNHVKTEVFQHRQDEIPCRRRARNTVKKQCFLTPRAKYTVNFRDFEGGVVWRRVGGRVGSA